jgi:hypothetical protein
LKIKQSFRVDVILEIPDDGFQYELSESTHSARELATTARDHILTSTALADHIDGKCPFDREWIVSKQITISEMK